MQEAARAWLAPTSSPPSDTAELVTLGICNHEGAHVCVTCRDTDPEALLAAGGQCMGEPMSLPSGHGSRGHNGLRSQVKSWLGNLGARACLLCVWVWVGGCVREREIGCEIGCAYGRAVCNVYVLMHAACSMPDHLRVACMPSLAVT